MPQTTKHQEGVAERGQEGKYMGPTIDDELSAIVRSLPSSESGNENLVLRIVRLVAAETGLEPTQLDPLGDVLDADALESLVASGGFHRVTFDYSGYLVSIDPDGTVRLHDGAE